MNLQSVTYSASYGISKQLPVSVKPEVAFVGRSNVGKSSLINKIFNRKSLAKTSSKPGKTSTINFFSIKECDFVDLPGYGFAKVAKSEKGRWSELIEGYFNQDREFALVVSLIDIRHDPAKLDLDMVEFLLNRQIPFVIVLTKADKLSRAQQDKQIRSIRKILDAPDDFPMIAVSSTKGTGIDEVRDIIQQSVEACYFE